MKWLAFAAVLLASCGNSAQYTIPTVTVHGIGQAEEAYRLAAKRVIKSTTDAAIKDCEHAGDVTKCMRDATEPLFEKVTLTNRALDVYHEAERKAAACVEGGGAVSACFGDVSPLFGRVVALVAAFGVKVQ